MSNWALDHRTFPGQKEPVEWQILSGDPGIYSMCCNVGKQHPRWLVSDYHQVQKILFYEDSVAAHLSKILTSDQHSVVISSAKWVLRGQLF